MKKILKRVVSVILIFFIIIPTTKGVVFANNQDLGNLENEEIDITLTKVEKKDLDSERAQIIKEIKKSLEKENEEYDSVEQLEIIEETLENNPQTTLQKAIEEEVSEGDYIEEVDVNVPEAVYNIDEETQITFLDDVIMVDEFIVTEEEDVANLLEEDLAPNDNKISLGFFKNILPDKVSAASKSKRKNASHTRNIYEITIFGKKFNKQITAHIAAEFTYNGSKVTARRTANFIKANGLNGTIINVSNKKSAVQKPSNTRRIAYQSGTLKAGAQIKGVGLIWSTKYLRVNVESNKNGTIKKSSTFK